MKKAFLFTVLLIAVNAQAQILKPMDDLFARYGRDTQGKNVEEVVAESLANYEAFIKLDVNSQALSGYYFKDQEKPKFIKKEIAQIVLKEVSENKVVSMYYHSKYDPGNKGIGFCFGRAMFSNVYLAQAGFDRGSIKKAFVIGPMSKGSWGWHVTTIAQSQVNGKEVWITIDPVTNKIQDVKQWYKEMQKMSDDGKLKLYIAEAGKFGAGPSNYNEDSISHPFYNNYFKDMRQWFAENDVSHRLF